MEEVLQLRKVSLGLRDKSVFSLLLLNQRYPQGGWGGATLGQQLFRSPRDWLTVFPSWMRLIIFVGLLSLYQPHSHEYSTWRPGM